MNKPTAFAFLMGNNFTFTCAAALTCYLLAWLAQAGTVNPVALLACIGLTSVAWKARRRIRAFPHIGKEPVRRASLFMVIIVWIGAPVCVMHLGYDPGRKNYEICCMLWGIASIALIISTSRLCWNILRLVQRRYVGDRAQRDSAPCVVEVILPLPSASPRPPQIVAALPGYAVLCLKHSV
jgi:hypothetical protein